jgi:hypothetical protein
MRGFAIAAALAAVALLAGAPARGDEDGPSSARTAQAPVHYGGGIAPSLRRGGVSMSLAHDGDAVRARASITVSCRGLSIPNTVVLARGTAAGTTVFARGSAVVVRRLRLHFRLTGSVAADRITAAATLRLRRRAGGPRGCERIGSFPVVLRREGVPTGEPARPAPRTIWRGVTAQRADGVRLPLQVAVAGDGRVVARWHADLRCGGFRLPVDNWSPPVRVGADGAFVKRERFRLRYRDGIVERYRMVFRGRFLTDGVTGTLRARLTASRRGRLLGRCDSGTVPYSALP